MSIATELTRIQTAKADIKSAIEAKGVTVPSSALIDEYDTYIAQISGGSSDLRDLLEKDITSVDIPAGTTKIGSYAFIECTSLASVSIPNSVTRIETDAFNNCSSLTSVNIPDSVTFIGNGAFLDCSGLTSVNIPYGIITIAPSVFEGCRSLTDITIPSSVTTISNSALKDCRGLLSITVEATTPPTLGTNALSNTNNCPIYVPAASVATYQAASGWSDYASRIFAMPIVAKFNVTNTSQPTQLIYYDERWAPDTKTSFSKIIIDGVVQNNVVDTYRFNTTGEHTVNYILSDPTTIVNQVFSSCSSLTNITIPNSVTSIDYGAFFNCTGLTSINIPNSVISIGNGAFSNCSGLTSVAIPESVTSIDSGAFVQCNSLANIVVESGNSVYDSRNNCNAIIETATNTLVIGCKNTVIPNTVTVIGYDAFYYCSGLTSITIPDSVTTIDQQAFQSCSGLTSVTIGNGVTSIGLNALSGCSGLTSITIPNSVTSIGQNAIGWCNNLTSITIGNGITNIGQNAFNGNQSLTSFTIQATTPPTLGSDNSFTNTNNCPIYVPSASVNAYKTAQYWSTYADRIQAIS